MVERGNVKTFNLALGSKETTLPLYVASESSEARQDDPSSYNTFQPHFVRESLAFTETVDVPVRTIESLVKSGELPEQIGFLKVDTEGFDLEVVRDLGMSGHLSSGSNSGVTTFCLCATKGIAKISLPLAKSFANCASATISGTLLCFA